MIFRKKISIGDDLRKSYSDKILGVRNYKSNKNEFFTADFINLSDLGNFLGEVSTGESDLTPAGLQFLVDCYGSIQDIAGKIVKGSFDNEFIFKQKDKASMIAEYTKWLEGVEPMEIASFIAEARSQINENSKLNIRLLPPEK